MWPHRRQPTRLLCPWDSPGKNTGVGCHFLLQCMKIKSESEVAQSCPTLSNPMDCSLPGCSIHGIFQARVLEWGAIAFSVTWTRRSTNIEQRGNSATNFKTQRHKTGDSVISLLQQVLFNSSSHNGSSFLWRYISLTVLNNLVPDDSWDLLSSMYHKYVSSHRDHVFLLLLYLP